MIGPATHRADAKGVFIHPRDTAWDHERIRREREAIERRTAELVEGAAPDARRRIVKAHRHPFDVYRHGWTRYDLSAPMRLFVPREDEDGQDRYVEVRVSEYLVRDDAERIDLRRLSHEEWLELTLDLQPRADAAAKVAAIDLAEAYALVGLDREREAKAKARAAEMSSGRTAAELYDLAADMPTLVGDAAIAYSAPPMEHELFPSA